MKSITKTNLTNGRYFLSVVFFVAQLSLKYLDL